MPAGRSAAADGIKSIAALAHVHRFRYIIRVGRTSRRNARQPFKTSGENTVDKNSLVKLLSAVCAGIAYGAAALAAVPEAKPAAEATSLEEIIVQAQKRSESAQNVPIALTALDAAAIERSHSRDIQGVAQLAPNLIVDPILGNGTAAISIRGMQLNDVEKSFDPAVAVYLDGIYLANTTGALLQMFDAAEVEVLRGPQGTLFGRNTIGGLLNIRRAQPTGELGGKISLGYGRFDQFDGHFVLNFPSLWDGKIKTKITASRQSGGGYWTNVSKTLYGKQEGDTSFTGLSLFTVFTPLDKLEFSLIVDLFDDHTPTRPVTSITGPLEVLGAFLGGAPAGDDNYHGTTHTSLLQNAFLRTKAETLNTKWQATDTQRIVSVTGYRETEENAIEEFDGQTTTIPGVGELSFFNTQRPQKSHQFSEELRLESDWTSKLRSTIGLYYFDGAYWLRQLTFFGGGPFGAPYYKQLTKSEAAFGQVDWEFIDNLTLSLGGRYNHEKKDACAINYNAASPNVVLNSFGTCNAGNYLASYVDPVTGQTINQSGEQTWSKFTPRVNLTYRIDPAKIAYVTYSEGFRSGGFNGRSADPKTLGPYAPEKVKSVEIGTKTQWFDNRLRVNVSAFHTKYDNKQEDVVFPDPNLVTVTLVQNAASATLNGAEFEITAIPVQGFTAGLNVGVLDAKYDTWTVPGLSGGIVDKSGFKLRRAPKFTAALNLLYEQNLAGGDTVSYGANYSFKDDYYVNANTIGVYDVTPTAGFNGNPGHVKSYGDLDLSVSYDAHSWKVTAWGKNMTNERHFMHVLDVGTNYNAGPNNTPVPVAGLWTFGTLSPPRTYGAEVQFKF
jgi:iron complex outermembrane receptor protein